MTSGKIKIFGELLSILLIGLLVYALTRNNILILTFFADKHSIDFIHCPTISNYVPDILWAIACMRVANYLQKQGYSNGYYAICIILPILLESLQYFFEVLGTFDTIDLSIYFLIIFSHLIISRK